MKILEVTQNFWGESSVLFRDWHQQQTTRKNGGDGGNQSVEKDKEKERVGWKIGRFIQATYFVAHWKGKTSSLLSTVKPLSNNRGADGTTSVWIKEPPQMTNKTPTLFLSSLRASLRPREVMGKLAKWAKGEAVCECLSMKRLKSWGWSLCFHSHGHYCKGRGRSEHDQQNRLNTSSHASLFQVQKLINVYWKTTT